MVALAPYIVQVACLLNLKNDYNDPSPLIFSRSGNNSNYNFVLPSKDDGTVCFNTTDEILLLCPDSYVTDVNNKSLMPGRRSSVPTFCDKNIPPSNSSRRSSNKIQKSGISCKSYPKPRAHKSSGNPCPHSLDKYTIDVAIDDYWINILTVCYDPNYYNTFCVKHTLYSQIKGAQSGKRPSSWTEEGIFNLPIPLEQLYKKQEQQKTINTILGLEPDSSKYISLQKKGNFLSKGHLSPKGDHIYGAAQSLTFHYLNSAPQWTTFNSGNWLILEKQVRKFSAKRKSELIVYTGTHGISTLPDVNGDQQELYLFIDENNNRAVPVPKYFWKIIYDPASKTGNAFVGVNNPFYFYNKTDVLCDDICHKIKWPQNKHAHNVTRGYFYCCDVNDLRQSIPDLPKDLQVDYLLV